MLNNFNIKYNRYLKNPSALKLIKNFLSLSSLNVLQFVISLITVPYLIKTIGIENLGKINFVLAFVAYFINLIDYGFIIQATREIAITRDNKDVLNIVFSKYFFSKIYNLIILSIIYFLIIWVVPMFQDYFLLYLYAYLTIVGKLFLFEWYYQGTEKMEFIAILNAISKIIYIICLFLFVTKTYDYQYVLLFQGLNSIAIGFASMLIIVYIHKIVITKVPFMNYFDTMINGYPLFVNQFLPNLYNNSTIFILGIFSSNVAVGLISSAKYVTDLANMILQMITRTFFPFLNRNISKHSIFRNIMIATTIVLFMITFAFSGLIANLLVKDDIHQLSFLIQILSFGTLGFSLYLIYGNYLIIHKKDSVLMKISFLVSITGFIFSFPFVYFFDEIGAALNLSLIRILFGLICTITSYKLISNGKTNYDFQIK